MSARTVSVVIPSYGSPEKLNLCLASLEQQTVLPRDIQVVSDGDPDPGCAEVATRYSGVTFTTIDRTLLDGAPVPNVARAINTGVGLSTGELTLVIQRDHILEPTYLEYLLIGHEHGAVDSGMSVRLDTTPTLDWVRSIPVYRALDEYRAKLVSIAQGFNKLYYRWSLADGLDFATDREHFAPLEEDPRVFYHVQAEWSLRMQIRGYRHMLNPLCRLWHIGGDTKPNPETDARVRESQLLVSARYNTPDDVLWSMAPVLLYNKERRGLDLGLASRPEGAGGY